MAIFFKHRSTVLYFNHPLIKATSILSYLQDHLSDLSQIKPEASGIPSKLEQFQCKLRAIYFNKAWCNAEVLADISKDPRFASYPQLQAILSTLLNLSDPRDLGASLNQLQRLEHLDWQADPSQFERFNQHYRYFPAASPEHLALFADLSAACRIQIIFFEDNNSQDDHLAYTYAYKLMALYLDPSQSISSQLSGQHSFYIHIHQLMRSVQVNQSQPLQQALTLSLPRAQNLADSQGWRNLLIKGRLPALRVWLKAEKIEQINHHKAPLNLTEARHLFLKSHYPRAEEDLAFAKLCLRYQISELRFNQCLDYIQSGWPKKGSDTLPDLEIQGQGLAHGLIWRKLPIADKRGLILGDITPCVKDGYELASNGFYVLLQQKSKKQRPPIIGHELNDQDYKIVGQAYVWKSILGNLCLDSFEYFAAAIRPEAIQAILSDFALALFAKFPKIHYLTLSQGEKNLEHLFPKAKISELIYEGIPYTDALQQYCVARKAPPELPIYAQFAMVSGYAREYLLAHASPLFLDLLRFEALGSQLAAHLNQDFIIQGLIWLDNKGLLNQSNFSCMLTHPNFEQIFYHLSRKPFDSLVEGELAQNNFTLIARHAQPRQLMLALHHLQAAKILTPRNRSRLASQANLLPLEAALKCLLELGILSHLNFSLLLSHEHMHVATIILHQARLLNQTHFLILASHQNPSGLVSALTRLKTHELLTAEHIQSLGQHIYPKNLSNALCYLKQAWLLNPENEAVLAAHPRPMDLAIVLEQLHNMKILDDENRSVVAQHPLPQDLAEALYVLYQAELLNSENRGLVASSVYPRDLADTICRLDQLGLFNPINCRRLLEHPNQAKLFSKIQKLKYTKRLDQSSFDALFSEEKTSTHSLFSSKDQGASEVTAPKHLPG